MPKAFTDKDDATRFGAARGLSQDTLDMWMATLREMLPLKHAVSIVDLGAGTGRFSGALHAAFDAPVIAVEPSGAMLEEGKKFGAQGVEWRLGTAEQIPVETASIDLVWMSQVFHHLDQPDTAFQEIRRILAPGGCLALRNGTAENDKIIDWYTFFPEAHTPVPSRQQAIDVVSRHEFTWLGTKTVWQFFVPSHKAYYERIALRGLSALIDIPDEAFEAGLRRMAAWVEQQPKDQPVYEPMDLFCFQSAR